METDLVVWPFMHGLKCLQHIDSKKQKQIQTDCLIQVMRKQITLLFQDFLHTVQTSCLHIAKRIPTSPFQLMLLSQRNKALTTTSLTKLKKKKGNRVTTLFMYYSSAPLKLLQVFWVLVPWKMSVNMINYHYERLKGTSLHARGLSAHGRL